MANTDTEVIDRISEQVKVEEPKLWKVILHNDDTTSFDFVIAVLIQIFHKDEESAARITMDVHNNGSGIAGIYTKEIAEEKTYETLMFAAANNYPDLTVTFEEMWECHKI